MKIFSARQLKEADRFTIANEPISSIDLMERASQAFVKKFHTLYPGNNNIKIFCGIGNNGGDGLVIGRLLKQAGRQVSVFVVGNYNRGSEDFTYNYQKFQDSFGSATITLLGKTVNEFPEIEEQDVVIDAILGSGLSKPVTGVLADLISYLNSKPFHSISVDIASGLGVDRVYGGAVFEPHHTISFQFPKQSFFSEANAKFVGVPHVVNIGLSDVFIRQEQTNYHLTEKSEIQQLIPKREKYTYKNKVGYLKIVAGSKGKMGAAILCAKAAFRAGAGIMDIHVPKCGTTIAQMSLPEAMVEEDDEENLISSIPLQELPTAIGPGIGQGSATVSALRSFLKQRKRALVIDADGLNILAADKVLQRWIPQESILTPHEGEFKRLVGDWEGDTDKFEKLSSFAAEHKLNLVLKGPYSAVVSSQGHIHFNPTGNPLLATAGSGDVLTGVIASFLAQGLKPADALKLGVYIHGLAADILFDSGRKFGVIASDIVEALPQAIASVSK